MFAYFIITHSFMVDSCQFQEDTLIETFASEVVHPAQDIKLCDLKTSLFPVSRPRTRNCSLPLPPTAELVTCYLFLTSEFLTLVSVPFSLKINIVVGSFECVLEIRGKNRYRILLQCSLNG